MKVKTDPEIQQLEGVLKRLSILESKEQKMRRQHIKNAVKNLHLEYQKPFSEANVLHVQKQFRLSRDGAIKLIAKSPEQYTLKTTLN